MPLNVTYQDEVTPTSANRHPALDPASYGGPLTGSKPWYYVEHLSHDELVTTILSGKGQAMPSFAGALTPQELTDLIAFLETRQPR